MLCLSQSSITKLLVKPQKEEKEATIYRKITPLEALVDWEGWKVYIFKCMYVARLPALIQVIWFKGNKLTYVAKIC